MKHLGGSGGSTKIAGLYGAWEAAYEHGYHADVLSGISASAILAVPYALRMHDAMREIVLNLKHKDFFSISPVRPNGNIHPLALIRLLFGKSLGRMDNLVELLRDLVPKGKFEAYKRSASYPDAVIMAVNVHSGARKFVNVKSLTYQRWLDFTLASASIPLFTPPVEMSGEWYYDGGLRDHNVGHYMIDQYQLTESISVYSRPKDFADMPGWKEKNQHIHALERTIDIMNNEISKNDDILEKALAMDKGVKLTQVYLPWLLDNLYDVDNIGLRELYQAGRKNMIQAF